MGSSLQKKLKQKAWHHDCITEVVELETAQKELGVVAQKIRERFQNAHVAPFGWLKNLNNLEKEVLGLLVEGEKDDGVSKRLLRISKREK